MGTLHTRRMEPIEVCIVRPVSRHLLASLRSLIDHLVDPVNGMDTHAKPVAARSNLETG